MGFNFSLILFILCYFQVLTIQMESPSEKRARMDDEVINRVSFYVLLRFFILLFRGIWTFLIWPLLRFAPTSIKPTLMPTRRGRNCHHFLRFVFTCLSLLLVLLFQELQSLFDGQDVELGAGDAVEIDPTKAVSFLER